MAVAAVIPALNEAPTIGAVVDAATPAPSVDEVIVVDSGSVDETARIAAERGARMVPHRGEGKGQAMATGVAATEAEVIVFLDGDLLGLRSEHVERLAATVVSGTADMACGLFDRGPVLNPIFLHLLPILTGERAVRRDLFEGLDREDIRGYKVEAALNARTGDLGLRRVSFVCEGLWHRTKEEKYPTPVAGFLRKVLMLLTATWSYLSYCIRRRLRRRPGAPPS